MSDSAAVSGLGGSDNSSETHLERAANETNQAFAAAALKRYGRVGRDPDRMMRVLGKLGQVWSELPDWRLGQLIVNLLPTRLGNDAFYLEDDDLEKVLDIVLEQGFAAYSEIRNEATS